MKIFVLLVLVLFAFVLLASVVNQLHDLLAAKKVAKKVMGEESEKKKST